MHDILELKYFFFVWQSISLFYLVILVLSVASTHVYRNLIISQKNNRYRFLIELSGLIVYHNVLIILLQFLIS